MGFMTKIFGGKMTAVGNGETGGHVISKGGALANTDSSVPSPHNADFSSIRSAPVVPKPRYFSINEANALQALAKEKRERAEITRQAYKSLKSIDSSDTEVHEVHRGYQTKLAKNEVVKLQANTRYAEQLHALRPEYEKMGQRIETADRSASDAINAIRQTYGA
jgi:hypothetical protein